MNSLTGGFIRLTIFASLALASVIVFGTWCYSMRHRTFPEDLITNWKTTGSVTKRTDVSLFTGDIMYFRVHHNTDFKIGESINTPLYSIATLFHAESFTRLYVSGPKTGTIGRHQFTLTVNLFWIFILLCVICVGMFKFTSVRKDLVKLWRALRTPRPISRGFDVLNPTLNVNYTLSTPVTKNQQIN